ncbi:MAG: Crp/Fnr family transcriptional regulator [Candidatus Eisenbacteria bacterium]
MLTTEQMEAMRKVLPASATLSSRLLAELTRYGRFVEFDRGATLFDDGDACAGLLVVTEGRARVSKQSPDGRELLLYEIEPGEFCVLTVNCLLGRSLYPARGDAVEEIAGILIPGDLFERLIASNPDFREAVFKMLGTRLAEMLVLVEQVAFARLDSRLAALLLRYGRTRGSVLVTHQQLADDLGCTREIVSRLLTSFQARGLVTLGRKRIDLTDQTTLAELAEES